MERTLTDFDNDLPPGATPLEDIDDLIPPFITTRRDLFDAEFKNIAVASHSALASRRKFRMEIPWLYKLHRAMFRYVWKWAGKKRRTNTNIGVDASQIDTELMKLAGDYRFWLEHPMDPLEISARLHHRLVQIYPFFNGNGRWARLAGNIFLKQQVGKVIQWPERDSFSGTSFREAYIQALHEADALNYNPLIAIHQQYANFF